MKNSTLIALSVLTMLLIFSCGGDNSTGPEENVAPVLKGVSASITAAAYGALVTITANASDGNKDALTYAWSCTGGSFSNVTTTESGRAAVTNSGKITWKAPAITDTFTVSVTVSDKIESVNSSIVVSVLGLFVENFTSGFSNWTSERCTASLSNGALKIVGGGTSNDYPYGGSYHELTTAIPIPYQLKMKVAWVTAVPSNYGLNPYIYVNDTGSANYNKFALCLVPSSITPLFYIANAPKVYPRFNQNDYNLLVGGTSTLIPTKANQWVEVAIAVDANKVLEVSLGGRSLATFNITSLESKIGRTIDMTLKRVGFDLHTGTVMIDDVIIDIPKNPAP